MRELKEIYILHEYYTPSHFNALYYKSIEHGYKVKDYIVISRYSIFKSVVKDIIKRKSIINSIKKYIRNELNLFKLKKFRNEILIVGIAPYDKIIKKYSNIFRNNKTIYFTSWSYWDEEDKYAYNRISRNEYISIINNNMHSIACVSKAAQRTIKKEINKNIKVNQVRHSIQVNEYEKKKIIDEKEFCQFNRKFIFLGQLIKRKSVDTLIDWIKQSDDNFEFYFAGDGELKSEIIKLESTDSRVKYLGFLSKAEIKKTLKNYDFMVLPSKEEPYGIVLIEALASGVPCIVSNAIGPSEIIENGKTGIVISDDINIEVLNKNLKSAVNIKYSDYIYMVEQCIHNSYKYDVANVMDEWVNLFQ